jgi:hypothetical protein
MFNLIDKIPYLVLIFLGVFLMLAPFTPEPHLLEKLKMLRAGTLVKPIDIFDLFYHLSPVLILSIKLARNYFYK